MDDLLTLDRRVFVKGVGYVSLGLVMGVMTGGCESWLDQIANRPVRRRLRTGSAVVDSDIATYRSGDVLAWAAWVIVIATAKTAHATASTSRRPRTACRNG